MPILIYALKAGAVLFVALISWKAACDHITYEPITYDAGQNLAMAVNFYNHGVLSQDYTGSSVTPTAHRLPAYPFFVSLAMNAAFERGEIEPREALAAQKPALQEKINRLKYGNILVFLLLVAGTFIAAHVLTGSFIVSLAACLCIALSRDLHENINLFLTESLTSLLLLLLSLGMALLVKARRRTLMFFAAGALLGLLALSNAVYFYFFLPALPLLWLGARRTGLPPLPSLRRIGAFSLAFVLLTGAWMARNQYHFDRFFLTERGGGVLCGRAMFSEMNTQEYLASFLYWTNNDTAKRLLNRFFSPEQYSNLDRESEHGFRARVIARERELLQLTGSQVQTDKLMVEEGKAMLRDNFLKHLLTTTSFAYRGIFISQRLYLWDDIYLLKGTYVCYLLFCSLLALGIRSLLKRDVVLCAFLAPSLFSYAFFSFFTHNIPRYNLPLLPVLWIATVIVLYRYAFRHIPGAATMLFGYCGRRFSKSTERG